MINFLCMIFRHCHYLLLLEFSWSVCWYQLILEENEIYWDFFHINHLHDNLCCIDCWLLLWILRIKYYFNQSMSKYFITQTDLPPKFHNARFKNNKIGLIIQSTTKNHVIWSRKKLFDPFLTTLLQSEYALTPSCRYNHVTVVLLCLLNLLDSVYFLCFVIHIYQYVTEWESPCVMLWLLMFH